MDRDFFASQGGASLGLPWPSTRDEAFRYTPLKALAARALPVGDDAAGIRAIDLGPRVLPVGRCARLVFVHGVWRQDLSEISALPAGVSITAGAESIGGEPRDAFEALNHLHARALAIRVAPGVQITKPLELIQVAADASADLAWYARVEIELGAGASVSLVEHQIAAGDPAHVGNLVCQIVLGKGAVLSHLRVSEEGSRETRLATTVVELATGARYVATALFLGGMLSRHAVRAELAGAGAEAIFRGVAVLGGRQHGETQIEIRHSVGCTSSEVLWRAAADGRSRSVFRGRIAIAAGADGSSATLTNKNLLLSPHAEVDTRPELEIDADEVQASHGATVGQLDERALFYLRARGVPAVEARAMLTRAFCMVALGGIADPTLAEHLASRLDAHLPMPRHGGRG